MAVGEDTAIYTGEVGEQVQAAISLRSLEYIYSDLQHGQHAGKHGAQQHIIKSEINSDLQHSRSSSPTSLPSKGAATTHNAFKSSTQHITSSPIRFSCFTPLPGSFSSHPPGSFSSRPLRHHCWKLLPAAVLYLHIRCAITAGSFSPPISFLFFVFFPIFIVFFQTSSLFSALGQALYFGKTCLPSAVNTIVRLAAAGSPATGLPALAGVRADEPRAADGCGLANHRCIKKLQHYRSASTSTSPGWPVVGEPAAAGRPAVMQHYSREVCVARIFRISALNTATVGFNPTTTVLSAGKKIVANTVGRSTTAGSPATDRPALVSVRVDDPREAGEPAVAGLPAVLQHYSRVTVGCGFAGHGLSDASSPATGRCGFVSFEADEPTTTGGLRTRSCRSPLCYRRSVITYTVARKMLYSR
ncbi:hypothetical protein KSP39_PZI002268 [Platanthera zijinensis]|uniref:Uncharacterized protein n=1 Tax=Platanthera zijinensis TaxID=2320716 RepID=A0AAP0BXN4_9ASPA